MRSEKIAVVDIETTGNSYRRGDRIIQFAVVLIENMSVTETYSSFVNPVQPIPPFITELTGITEQDVADAPDFKMIAPRIQEMLKGAVFVAHNVQFDLPFLNGALRNADLNEFSGPAWDTVELSRALMPEAASFKLGDLTENLLLEHDRPHQADSDALATAELLISLHNKVMNMPLLTVEQLAGQSAFLKSDLDLFFELCIEEKKKNLTDLPDELEVFRGIAIRKKQLVQKSHFKKPEIEIENFISELVPGYQKREAQLQMITDILTAFQTQSHAVIEAGTGVGKTLGLLIPAVIKVNEGKKICITTQTLQQQDQLLETAGKINALLHNSLATAVLKGRSNYIHMMKFEQSLKENDRQYDTVLAKMQLLTWLTETETGDIDELNLSGGSLLYWNRIRHSGWYLDKNQDPWAERDFYSYSLKKAEQADIVITNHAMLAVDKLKDTGTFPRYDHLMIDEAHHLEETCRNQWGIRLDYMKIKFAISRLTGSQEDGISEKLHSILNKHKISCDYFHPESWDRLNQETDASFYQLGLYFKNHVKRQKGFQKQKLLLQGDHSDWKYVKYSFERLLNELKNCLKTLLKQLEAIGKKKTKLTVHEKAAVEDAGALFQEWERLIEIIRTLFIRKHDQYVNWIEGDLRSIPGSLTIVANELDLKDKIQHAFFDDSLPAVAVSATLAVNDSFDHFIQSSGLAGKKLIINKYESPFDYRNHVRLMVPNDLPDIKSVTPEEYVEWITGHLAVIAEATSGRMLVLFTSHEMLRNTYELIKESQQMEDFVLIAQGISAGSRTKLSKNFRKFDKAVLFGTSSFWEGLDIPGEDLSCLVMVRLPFSPPDEPLVKAQWERAKSENRNPFQEVSLPKAVLRFRQGFGRLIRHENDRGIFMVFDRRLLSASYGKAFTDSIPEMKVEEKSLDECIFDIEEWL
ncbi:ATP-dependent DNA helicase DinG [Jeotgalibacillus haloalkalitolerans]|uniref:3'-5' exonuclease DinG n=1 Tax=Jeotgalibacillus haloalkalitolerans TaxID=3104292 RepID=A0ABU5KLD7_9BACL|nr:ATP-dependent DNA helicase DinG [Jeotgalibacillus sp. HH7-29]MDZ5711985.1 ATP-dependent DNA helicase DinG [Jeotgalibacillus sp. HH7-29]